MAVVNMENRKQIIIIAMALAAGVVASVLVGVYVQAKINEETRKLAYQYEKAQKQKDQQNQEQLAILNQKIIEVEQRSRQAAEQVAQSMAAKNAQASVTPDGIKKKPSMAVRTPAGKRAITVQIDSLNAVGGLLNPGDFVDIISHLNVPTGKRVPPVESVTAMIFQNLQVLAINTNIDETGIYDAQQNAAQLKITFAVDPQEAGLLSFADINGKLQLTLRTTNEKGRTMLPRASWSTLADYILENSGADIQGPDTDNEETDKKVYAVEETKPFIQVYRGGREF